MRTTSMNVRGEREERLRSNLKTVGTEGSVGQGITRLYKNTKTFYKPERITRASASPGTREKRMGSAESENGGGLQRMNAWVVEVREKTGCVVLTCRWTTCMVMVIHFDNLL
jgi:hypothetical protein